MNTRQSTVSTVTAFLLAFIAAGLTGLILDPTPLLVEPSPDLDWPLGLLGVAGGLWSARQIGALPYLATRKLGRAALWFMLPLWLAFGLAALGDRIHEAHSFRRGNTTQEVTVLVAEKTSNSGRSGRVFYNVGVVSPFDKRVDEATFNGIAPMAVTVRRADLGPRD